LPFQCQTRQASGETPQPPAMLARRSGHPSCSEMYPLGNETFLELVLIFPKLFVPIHQVFLVLIKVFAINFLSTG
jgi:hypothetical protein